MTDIDLSRKPSLKELVSSSLSSSSNELPKLRKPSKPSVTSSSMEAIMNKREEQVVLRSVGTPVSTTTLSRQNSSVSMSVPAIDHIEEYTTDEDCSGNDND